MSIFKLLILSLLLFVGCVPAHAVGLQVEAGNYRTANNDDLLFDTKHSGSAAGKIQRARTRRCGPRVQRFAPARAT